MPVFVSHSQEDEAAYTALCLALDGQSIPRWEPSTLAPGRPLADQLRSAIEQCEACVFLATRRSLASSWCLAEIGAFWGAGKTVVVYVADPDVSEADHPPQFRGHLWTSDARRLVDALREIELAPAGEGTGAVPRGVDYEVVRERVLDYLVRNGFGEMRFVAIQEFIDPSYTDDILFELVRRYHKQFRLAKVKRQQGLARL